MIARGETFYLVNDGFDRVMRLGPDGVATELGRSYFEAPYSLGFDGTSLAIAMDGRIVRIDPATGAATYAAFPLTGYLTAIAF